MDSLSIAHSGISAARLNAANATNNIVNAKSDGYQATQIFTVDLPYNNLKVAGAASAPSSSSNNISIGSGARVTGSSRDLSLGELKHTKDPFHLAINGAGYFRVLNPQTGSYRYTRNGRFSVDPTTQQLMRDGDLLAENITIPENININSLTILADGRVQGTDDRNEVQDLGQILIYTSNNPSMLENVANGLLAYPVSFGDTAVTEEATIQPHIPGIEGAGTITQGALESSNVNTEMQLLQVMDAYLWLEYCHQCAKMAYKADKLSIETLEVAQRA